MCLGSFCAVAKAMGWTGVSYNGGIPVAQLLGARFHNTRAAGKFLGLEEDLRRHIMVAAEGGREWWVRGYMGATAYAEYAAAVGRVRKLLLERWPEA